MGVIDPEWEIDRGVGSGSIKVAGVICCGVITPEEVTLRKNRMCRLHIGVIFIKLYYDSTIIGIVLGGSRARGTHHEKSDSEVFLA